MKITHQQLRALLGDGRFIIVAEGCCQVDVKKLSGEGEEFGATLAGSEGGLSWEFHFDEDCSASLLPGGTVVVFSPMHEAAARLRFYAPAAKADLLREAELALRPEGGKAFKMFRPDAKSSAGFGQLAFRPSSAVPGVEAAPAGGGAFGGGAFVYRMPRPGGGYSYAVCCVAPGGEPMGAGQVADLLELLGPPKASDLGITVRQRRNIARLATFVRGYYRTPQEGRRIVGFGMRYWAVGPDGHTLDPAQHECATAACFAGHGPLAGIDPVPGEGWLDYAFRNFAGAGGPRHAFLFGGNHPDCPDEACRRAAYFLQCGVPEAFDIVRYADKPPSVPDSFEPDWGFVEAVAEGRA